MNNPYLIAIAGPSCAGKSYLARHLVEALHGGTILTFDSYYPDLSHLSVEQRACRNFDDPQALDVELLVAHVRELASGRSIYKPVYDFFTHTRTALQESVEPSPYIIMEGLYALYWPELRGLSGTKVYVDMMDDICLARRMERDIRDRGRSAESVLRQYRETVAPMAAAYVRPTAEFADVRLFGADRIAEEVEAVLRHVRRMTKEHTHSSNR